MKIVRTVLIVITCVSFCLTATIPLASNIIQGYLKGRASDSSIDPILMGDYLYRKGDWARIREDSNQMGAPKIFLIITILSLGTLIAVVLYLRRRKTALDKYGGFLIL